MSGLRTYLQSELTPRLCAAIVCLLLLFTYVAADRLIKSNTQLAEDVRDKRFSLHQMATIQTDEIMKENFENVSKQNAMLKQRLLTDETDGLNDALFQSRLTSTLETCGASKIAVSTPSPPREVVQNLKEHVVGVRAKVDLELLGKCLYDIAKLDLHVNVSNLRWSRGGTILIDLKSYSSS